MQSISKPHNQHTPNATLGVMHYSTNQHMQQRHKWQHTHPTTCNESRLPYRDEGTKNCSRKNPEMMTLCNCGLTRNLILNFHRTTHLVMEVTIGHTYSMQHDFKPNTFAGITTCLYGITFNLTCSPQYTKWFEQLRHNWSPIIPKFDMDLVSSPRTSQSSQFSNSMCSPTTDVATQ